MDFEGNGLLTLTVFLPLVGALLIAVLVRNNRHVRVVAGVTIVLDLLLSFLVFTSYDLAKGGVQLVDRAPGWIPIDSFKVEYFLGVDGLSAPLVLLTGLLGIRRRLRLVEHQGAGARVFRVAADSSDGGHGRIHRAGLHPLLPPVGAWRWRRCSS